jgi:hypothetical protein
MLEPEPRAAQGSGGEKSAIGITKWSVGISGSHTGCLKKIVGTRTQSSCLDRVENEASDRSQSKFGSDKLSFKRSRSKVGVEKPEAPK